MSAAKIIVDRVTALSQFASKAFFFNLNYLPDTILGGIILFALLLQSIPLGLMGVLLFALEFVHAGTSSFLAEVIPGVHEPSKDIQRCSGHFPGISYERLTSTLSQVGTLAIMNNGFPSYYMMFVGALFGYMIGMGQTYEKELEGMPQRRAAVHSGVFLMGVLAFMFIFYRVYTNCDKPTSVIVGLFLGTLYGYLMEMFVANTSDRTMTNLLNIPLIRNRAEDGKPIYVCAKAP
jgi:hypothetical protein